MGRRLPPVRLIQAVDRLRAGLAGLQAELLGSEKSLAPGLFTPAQRYVALESQKLQLFEYGQPFKLHRRSRAELYNASIQR